MVKLGCTRSGVGAVHDPQGGLIQLANDIPASVAERLLDEYDVLFVEEGDIAEAPDESEEYHCGVNDCKRKVDNPDDTCWQHP